MMVTKNGVMCSHPRMYRCSVIQNIDESGVSLQETLVLCWASAADHKEHMLLQGMQDIILNVLQLIQDKNGAGSEKGWTGHSLHP